MNNEADTPINRIVIPEFDITAQYAEYDKVAFLGKEYQSCSNGLTGVLPTTTHIERMVSPNKFKNVKAWNEV